MNGLLTDLYELTMSAGYFEADKSEERATFELSIRKLPPNRNFVIAAGLAQAVEYLLAVGFAGEDIDYLRTLPQFSRVSKAFFERLRAFRFTGDLFAAPEGTPIFSGEPILTVRAPLIEAQVVETYLLATIGYQSLVTTKAARIVETARGRGVIEFGTRRAHSPEAGLLAARAAYIGGCLGTSNTLAGRRFGIPVYGTAAHSWVLAFPNETEAFAQLQKLLGEAATYVVDTYDSLEGTRRAAALGKPLWGIRLDSGDLLELSRATRLILDEAGLTEAHIMASGDLDEYKIRRLVEAGAPIDAFGVGTELVTSADAPVLPVVYKLVELETRTGRKYTAKFSEEKVTLPGAKQIYRFADYDEITCAWECRQYEPEAQAPQAILQPVLVNGQLVAELPDAASARSYAAKAISRLPESCRRLVDPEAYPIRYSDQLLALAEQARKSAY
jgi:nicotinate phosphoribosyltransferase